MTALRVDRLGARALRVTLPPGAELGALRAGLLRDECIQDVVVTERFVAVYFDERRPPRDVDLRVLALLEAPPVVEARSHVFRVRYDGEDLADVAARLGLAEDAVVELHAAPVYRVRFVGFLPGFAYLVGLDERLRLPRRSAPRPRVPPGAVAMAGAYTGMYPHGSPGGWHLIGTTLDGRFFDEAGHAVLAPGDAVRFEAVE